MTSRDAAIARALDAEALRGAVTSHRHLTAGALLAGLEAEGWTVARRPRSAVVDVLAVVGLLALGRLALDALQAAFG